MPLSAKLNRNLRPMEEETDDEEYYVVSDRSSPSVVDTGEGADIVSSGEEDEDHDEEMSDGPNEDQMKKQLAKVSFGVLAKAQASLAKDQAKDQNANGNKRKRGGATSSSQEDKLQAIRARLQELKAQKSLKEPMPSKKAKSSAKESAKGSTKGGATFAPDDDSDDSDGAPTKGRSSKHAPMEVTSKRAVTRRRTVIDVDEKKKPVFRDPRFDNVAGPAPDENTLAKRYGFLDDYKTSEIADLRASLKKTKDEGEKAKMKRQLLSMESQKKSRDNKAQQQKIISEHKVKEKELVKQGKQPFYLKKAEQKKLALVDRFQNMKGKERERIIERRRKKVSSREKKMMPADRRGTD